MDFRNRRFVPNAPRIAEQNVPNAPRILDRPALQRRGSSYHHPLYTTSPATMV